jgi:hypothetical protein
VGFPGQLRIDRLDRSGAHRQQLQAGGALDEDRQHRRLLDCLAGRELAVMGQQNRALVADRFGNDPPFLVADRGARPFRQPGAIVVEEARIHMRDGQRHADHR